MPVIDIQKYKARKFNALKYKDGTRHYAAVAQCFDVIDWLRMSRFVGKFVWTPYTDEDRAYFCQARIEKIDGINCHINLLGIQYDMAYKSGDYLVPKSMRKLNHFGNILGVYLTLDKILRHNGKNI